MKRVIYFMLFGLLVFTACNDAEVDHIFYYGREELFSPNEVYQSIDRAIELTIDSVGDSRCPVGVVCIWQGEVTAFLTVHINQTYHFDLHSVIQPKDTIEDYEFEIVDATPYPEFGKEINPEDYRVRLQVTRL